MLRIIPTPTDPKILYTLPGNWWEKELKGFYGGIYFEYSENDVLNFRFFYALGKISILEGPFSSECSQEMIEAIVSCSVSLEELWDWVDQIPFKVVKCLKGNDPSIKGVWKMEEYPLPPSSSFTLPRSIFENYYEVQISTVTVRSIPYNWGSIKFEILNEKDKIYWFTLCLLKYQRQSSQLLEESMNL